MTVDEISKKIEYYEKLKTIQMMEPRNFTEQVFLKYIELARTPDVAAYLNAKGHTMDGVRGSRKVISTDVTTILENPESESEVSPEIYGLVMKMKKSRRMLDRFLIP